MYRITRKILENRVGSFNSSLGLSDGDVGSYYVASEGGGTRVCCIVQSTPFVTEDITLLGTKREVFDWMKYYMDGWYKGERDA